MKRKSLFTLVLLLWAASFAFAQGSPGYSNYPTTINPASGAPSGNCPGTNVFYLNTSNGNFYTCPTPGSSYVLAGGAGTGTVSTNSGSAGALATYAAAGGSTTVGPDPAISSNATGQLTLGAVGVGAGTISVLGSTSGSKSVGCVPTTTCLAFGNAGTAAKFQGYQTGTNCNATGSAANPSAVACVGSTAGSFSCATNASGTTCVVSTTGVTAASAITITPVATYAGLTCNGTADASLTLPRLASISAGTSFTINLGTFSVTAECFTYSIVN